MHDCKCQLPCLLLPGSNSILSNRKVPLDSSSLGGRAGTLKKSRSMAHVVEAANPSLYLLTLLLPNSFDCTTSTSIHHVPNVPKVVMQTGDMMPQLAAVAFRLSQPGYVIIHTHTLIDPTIPSHPLHSSVSKLRHHVPIPGTGHYRYISASEHA